MYKHEVELVKKSIKSTNPLKSLVTNHLEVAAVVIHAVVQLATESQKIKTQASHKKAAQRNYSVDLIRNWHV